MNLIIVGAGRIGTHLAELALQDGHVITLVEANEKRVQAASQQYDAQVLQADIAQGGILDEAGADQTDGPVATTSDDSANLMAMFLGIEYSVKTLLSVVNDTRHKRLFERLGVHILVATPSYSQPVPTDREIQASGGFFHAQGADVGTVSGDISHGYFLQGNRAWEIGLRQDLSYAFIDNGKDAWSATTVPFFNYHFHDFSKDDRLVPFVGGFLGGTWNDDDATGTLGPELGAKYFVNDRTFLRIGYRYE